MNAAGFLLSDAFDSMDSCEDQKKTIVGEHICSMYRSPKGPRFHQVNIATMESNWAYSKKTSEECQLELEKYKTSKVLCTKDDERSKIFAIDHATFEENYDTFYSSYDECVMAQKIYFNDLVCAREQPSEFLLNKKPFTLKHLNHYARADDQIYTIKERSKVRSNHGSYYRLWQQNKDENFCSKPNTKITSGIGFDDLNQCLTALATAEKKKLLCAYQSNDEKVYLYRWQKVPVIVHCSQEPWFSGADPAIDSGPDLVWSLFQVGYGFGNGESSFNDCIDLSNSGKSLGSKPVKDRSTGSSSKDVRGNEVVGEVQEPAKAVQ